MASPLQQHLVHMARNENLPLNGVSVQQQHTAPPLGNQAFSPSGPYIQQQQNQVPLMGKIAPPSGLVVHQQQQNQHPASFMGNQNLPQGGLVPQEPQYPAPAMGNPNAQQGGPAIQQQPQQQYQGPVNRHPNASPNEFVTQQHQQQPQQQPFLQQQQQPFIQQQQQQYLAPPVGNPNAPPRCTTEQQHNPHQARMNGTEFQPRPPQKFPLVKPEAFLQSSRISERMAPNNPHAQPPPQPQQSPPDYTQHATTITTDDASAQEWPRDLISAAFAQFGYHITLTTPQWIQTTTHLFSDPFMSTPESDPVIHPLLTWHKLVSPPLVPRLAGTGLSDEQQATAVVARILEIGLVKRQVGAGAGAGAGLELDKAFVLATFEFLISVTLPVSCVAEAPVLVKCHHCGAPVVTRVECVRGGATWGCMYLMCFFWLLCLIAMVWRSEQWMNKRHYCAVCGELLALWEKMKGRRESKGIKIYTKWGNFRLQPGEELSSYIREA